MFGFNLAPLFYFAAAAVFGFVGLVIAVIVGIWADLPSWAYLAIVAGAAAIGAGWVATWDK